MSLVENEFRKTVWLDGDMRDIIFSALNNTKVCVIVNNNDGEAVPPELRGEYEKFLPCINKNFYKKLLTDLVRANATAESKIGNRRVPYDVSVVKAIFNLPDDVYPIHITDEELHHLDVCGGLPAPAVRVLTRNLTLITASSEDSELVKSDSDIFSHNLHTSPCFSALISTEKYNKLRKEYRKRGGWNFLHKKPAEVKQFTIFDVDVD